MMTEGFQCLTFVVMGGRAAIVMVVVGRTGWMVGRISSWPGKRESTVAVLAGETRR